jgi:hypothetical protein
LSLKPGKFQLSVAQNRGAPQKPLERTQNWIKLGGKVISINVVLMDRQKTRRYPAMGQGALRSSSYTIHRGRLVAFLTSGCILENPKIRKSAHFSNYENCAARFVRKFLYKNFYAPKAACICELLLGFSRSAQKREGGRTASLPCAARKLCLIDLAYGQVR